MRCMSLAVTVGSLSVAIMTPVANNATRHYRPSLAPLSRRFSLVVAKPEVLDGTLLMDYRNADIG